MLYVHMPMRSLQAQKLLMHIQALCWLRAQRPLDSEAIVEFVRALCAVAQEELRPVASPRVYSLTKIIEISHFNMSRIRRAPVLSHSAPLCSCAWRAL